MRNFIMGFVIGALLATVVTAYAASRIVWVDGSGNELGTASNPINVTL
jgi:hypothetical protein